MKIKQNNPNNWSNEWKNHSTTYVDTPNNPIDLNSAIQFDFIKDDILKYLPNGRVARIIEVGCGGAVIDWNAHIAHEFTKVSLWGHDFSVGNATRA